MNYVAGAPYRPAESRGFLPPTILNGYLSAPMVGVYASLTVGACIC
jgi:hypothetical protein